MRADGDRLRVEGFCEPRFQAVRDAFIENFAARGEVGAAVSVEIDGRPVVDLWGGWADAAQTVSWQRDTLVNVFSVGKAMAAVTLLRLVERRLVDLDAPVARYWPAFAAADKGAVTVRTLLCHRAGLPAIRRELPRLAMYDREFMTTTLAAEAPWWEPGTRQGYHVNTFGFLLGELVRRTCARSLPELFAAEIAGPLGADFQFGIGVADEARTAQFLMPEEPPPIVLPDEQLELLLRRAYLNPPGVSGFGTVNTRAWRSAELPSTNGHATARGITRVYSALARGGEVDGICILQRETIEEASAQASSEVDAVLGRPLRVGLGFQLTQPERPLGSNPHSFGHFGTGGSVGFADLDARLAFAYTMNQPGPRWQNPRNRALIEAVYACL